MSIVVYDPFRVQVEKQYLTGGPRYFVEVLNPFLLYSFGAQPSDSQIPTNAEVLYAFKITNCLWGQLFTGTRQLSKINSGTLVPISDDPRALLPCLLTSVFNKRLKIVVPIMHIIRPPNKRPGSRLRNSIAYLWQQCALWLVIMAGAQLIAINEVTYDYLQRRILTLSRLAKRESGCVTLLTPQTPPAPVNIVFPLERRLVMVGRIVEHKGSQDLPHLLKALNSVSGHHWQCSLIGHAWPPATSRMMSEAKKLGVQSSIQILGTLNDHDRNKILSSSISLVLLSHEEGYSYVIHDAVAAGKVVACWDLPELRAVWGGHSNVHFTTLGDFNQMADFLINLFDNGSYSNTVN